MMTLFRIFLAVFFLALLGYTLKIGMAQGWNLIPLFFAEIKAMTWQGQFNFDFAGFLLLSALWCGWRNHFSPAGWALALLGATGGMLFLSAYLLYLSARAKGDINTILLGEKRSAARLTAPH